MSGDVWHWETSSVGEAGSRGRSWTCLRYRRDIHMPGTQWSIIFLPLSPSSQYACSGEWPSGGGACTEHDSRPGDTTGWKAGRHCFGAWLWSGVRDIPGLHCCPFCRWMRLPTITWVWNGVWVILGLPCGCCGQIRWPLGALAEGAEEVCGFVAGLLQADQSTAGAQFCGGLGQPTASFHWGIRLPKEPQLWSRA